MTLQSGFTLGDWKVYPLEGRLVGEHGEQRLQPKTMDVLLCLAEGGGAVVQRDEILSQVWEGRAQSDEPLTRCIGELRRALGDARAEPEYIITIPKRGYRLLKEAVPLLRDEEAEVEVSTSADEDTPQLTEPQQKLRLGAVGKIGIAIAVLVAAALVEVFFERVLEDADIGLGGDQSSETETASSVAPEANSIAVLPFVDLSGDGEQEYFSDGIAEELLNLLTRVPELRVISRTSAFSYKGRNIDLPTIAQELNVAHVLEGSVRKDGNRVRITAQLIDARSDSHLWSESYERTLDGIFAIQDEIAARVVEKLKITLLGSAPTVQPTDPEAYALVLQAQYLGQQLTPDALERSIALYEQALAIDRDYAAAWQGLARRYDGQVGQGLRPIDEGYALAREAANNALALDPEYAPAHRILARIARNYDRDIVAAARHYERALAIEPDNIDSISGAANMAGSLGRLDQAIALAEYAAALDPVNPIGAASLGLFYLEAGRLDEAIASFLTTLTLSPGYIGAQYFIGTALLLKGEPEIALAAIQMETLEVWRQIGLATAHHALGQAAASDAALATLIEKYEQDAAYNIAYVLAFRGEADRAFEWLNKAVANNDPGLTEIATEHLFANIQSDPRWLPFLDSIGKSPEKLAAIEFKVTLPK